jgi:hypothetical protein
VGRGMTLSFGFHGFPIHLHKQKRVIEVIIRIEVFSEKLLRAEIFSG